MTADLVLFLAGVAFGGVIAGFVFAGQYVGVVVAAARRGSEKR